MIITRSSGRIAAFAVLIMLACVACSSTSYLKVTYQLPAAGDGPTGKTVFLKIVDNTGGKPFIGDQAKEALKDFSGLFSLYVAGKHPEPVLEGAYDMVGLYDVAFKERLTSAGVAVAEAPADAIPTLAVELTAFQIDRDGKSWTARAGYVARMQLAGNDLTTQTVDGTAERVKILGIGDAEKLLGEIVTDMVNRLDIKKLFDHPQV